MIKKVYQQNLKKINDVILDLLVDKIENRGIM